MTINAPIAEVNGPAVNARLEREAAAYRAGIAALKAPAEIIETTYHGTPARKIEGGAHVAIAASGRKNAAEWAILPAGAELHVDNVVCYLKRGEVNAWLARMAA